MFRSGRVEVGMFIIFWVVCAGPKGRQGMFSSGRVQVGMFIIIFWVVCAGPKGPQGP